MRKIGSLIRTVGWWFRTPDFDEVAVISLRVTRYVKKLETRVRAGSVPQKISSVLIFSVWSITSFIWTLSYYPICLVRSRYRKKERTENVVFVSHDGALNGAPQSLISILEWVDRVEFCPIVICGSEGPFIKETDDLLIPTIVLPLSVLFWEYRNEKFLYQLIRLVISFPFLLLILSSFPVRILHLNSIASPDAAFAGRLLFVKTVWHIRESSLDTKWGRMRLSVVAALSHKIIANSKFTESAIRSYGVASSRVCLIYNFLKKGFLQPGGQRDEIRQSLGVAPDDLLIGCVGRVSRDKGQDIFVRAAVELAKEYPSAHFLLIGSENDAAFVADLRQIIEASHLTARIRFIGVRDDVASIMRALDVHVTPSRVEETFGRVAMEAMASGAVSVVSNRGGLPEIVEDGKSGLIFAAEDEIDLAAKIKLIIADPQLRQNLSQAGIQRAVTVFSGDTQIGELHKIYRALLA